MTTDSDPYPMESSDYRCQMGAKSRWYHACWL